MLSIYPNCTHDSGDKVIPHIFLSVKEGRHLVKTADIQKNKSTIYIDAFVPA